MNTFAPKITQRGAAYEKYELRVFPGPQQLGVTGAADYDAIFGRQWLAVLLEDNSLLVYREGATDGDWTLVPTSDLPASLPADAKNLGAATQQDARFSVCYEDGAGLHVSQYDALLDVYTVRGPFAGVDPVLFNDAQINGVIGGSDVVMFYLSADRLTINYRLQSENYGTEHALFTNSVAMTLDMVTTGGLRYALWVSDANGDPLTLPLVSDLSDAVYGDTIVPAIGALQDGLLKLVVYSKTLAETMTVSVGALTDGVYYPHVIVVDVADSVAAMIGALANGTYDLRVLVDTESDAAAGTIGSLANGVYTLRVILRTPVAESAAATIGSLQNGAYV